MSWGDIVGKSCQKHVFLKKYKKCVWGGWSYRGLSMGGGGGGGGWV